MKTYVKSTQYELWYIITKEDIEIKLPREDWTEFECNQSQLNDKANYTLLYDLLQIKYKEIYKGKIVKEM